MEDFDSRLGDIYNQETSSEYYEVQGKDVEKDSLNEPDTFLVDLIPEDLEGKRVLDLGSGNARYSELLAERGAEQVIALDLSQSMSEQAATRKREKQLDNLEIIRGDIEALPIKKEKLDFVFSRFALMYSDKLSDTVKSLSESLADGGEMLVEVNVATFKDETKVAEIKKEPVPMILSLKEKEVAISNYAYSLEDYQQAFSDAGLEIEVSEIFEADDISVTPSYDNAEDLTFQYGVFKLRKKGK